MFVLVPKLYVSVVSGTRLLAIPATIVILSVASSPIVILPPIVTSPLTSKFPVMSTLSSRLITPLAESTLIAPAVLDIVFPESLRFPVSILSPLINVFCPYSYSKMHAIFLKLSLPKFAMIEYATHTHREFDMPHQDA